LTLLPLKYVKLTFDLYHRMTQLVSFETFKSNLNRILSNIQNYDIKNFFRKSIKEITRATKS